MRERLRTSTGPVLPGRGEMVLPGRSPICWQVSLDLESPTALTPETPLLLILYALNFKHRKGTQAARWGDWPLESPLLLSPFVSFKTGLWVAPINSYLEATSRPFFLVKLYDLPPHSSSAVVGTGSHSFPQAEPGWRCVLWVSWLRSQHEVPHAFYPRAAVHGTQGKEGMLGT